MLGLGKTGTVRGPDADGSARSQDIYQRYAAALYRQALYRQALLTPITRPGRRMSSVTSSSMRAR